MTLNHLLQDLLLTEPTTCQYCYLEGTNDIQIIATYKQKCTLLPTTNHA